MKIYIKFAIYTNVPSLALLTPIAAYNFVAGGNLAALTAFYNFILYIIPVTLILAYLIYSLRKGLKTDVIYKVVYFILATICMLLLIYAWFIFTPIVMLLGLIVSFAVTRVHRRLRPKEI